MKLIVLYISLCFCLHATAGVDPRHGVFYISYTDMEFPGTKADISRSYNSSSTNTGLFGYGWNSFIETRISALPDGSLSLQWWGTATDYYEAAVINKKGLYEMIDAIIADMIKNKKLQNDPVAIAEKRSYFVINNTERASKYISLQRASLAPVYVPPSTHLHWIMDVNQSIEWDGQRYLAKSWSNRYTFNSQGMLELINEKDYNMQLRYRGKFLDKIIVNDSISCTITTDAKGKIISMLSAVDGKNKEAHFTYDSADNLIYSIDAGDNKYWFQYDYSHNLVKIGYVDSTSLHISYDGATNRVIKLTKTNGAFDTYQYPYFYTAEGRINYDHYATRISSYDSLGRKIFSDYKEYENRQKEDGSDYLHRILETSDTSYHEVLYNAEVGNARYRKKNNKEAWALYDAKKRPLYLRIADSIYRTYFNGNDQPARFVAVDSIRKDSVVYVYSYHADGSLKQVKRDKEVFSVVHAGSPATTKISGSDGRELIIRFKNKQPYSIENKQLGITLVDDAEWQKMDSTLHASRKQDLAANNDGSRRNEKASSDAAISRPSTAIHEGVQEDRRKKLLALYHEWSDLLQPLKIEHEWIWQRM